MRAPRPRPTLPRGLSWLLWLVLLLPLAQTAAQWHGYAHGAAAVVAADGGGGEREDDPRSPHAAHCGLCLAAAHLGAGAMPAAPGGLQLPEGAQGWQAAGPSAVWHARLALAYQSRAPPLISC